MQAVTRHPHSTLPRMHPQTDSVFRLYREMHQLRPGTNTKERSHLKLFVYFNKPNWLTFKRFVT